MDCCTPSFPVHHQLPELAQTHVHRVGNAIQLSHPLSSLPSIFPSIRVSSSESVLHIRWPKYRSFSSVQFSRSVVSDSLWSHGLQHTRLSCPLLSPTDCSNSCHWVGDAIQPTHPVFPFFSCLQSFPGSGSFPMSWFFTSGGQSSGALASAPRFLIINKN